MAKCLVLGANGFIGSHMVDALVRAGHTVRAFDRFSSNQMFDVDSNIELFYGDFLNRSDIEHAVEGMEYVFHFISTTTPASAENDPLIDVETNIRISIELFNICVEQKVKRVLFSSTGGAIYGQSDKSPNAEDDLPLPTSPYAIGKLTIEHYLRYFKRKYCLESITFRISNPYGERQPLHRKQGVIPIFIENLVSGKPLMVYGDGSMVRDYIYVKDAAAMMAKSFDSPTQHEVYNIGSGDGTSINELVSAIGALAGSKPNVEHVTTPSTYVDEIVLDTSRYCTEFGEPKLTSLDEGLVTTYAYVNDRVRNNG